MRGASYAIGRCDSSLLREQTFFERWFPVPHLLSPLASGIDISDSSVKILTLKRAHDGLEVASFAQGPLAPGLVVGGEVRDPAGLGMALSHLREEADAPRFAHIALPEEAAYVFTMHIHDVYDRKNVYASIEFEFEGRVPLKPEQAVYDYDVLSTHPGSNAAEIAVSVFPKHIVEGYVSACEAAGITAISFEIEARSIARAVVPYRTNQSFLVVDFGRARTGIAILKGQIPIFTSTVDVGGDTITNIIIKELKVNEEEAEDFKNNKGILLSADPDKRVAEVISGTAAALSDEILRHYQYWDTRRDEHGERSTPISQVLLTGGSSNLKGLPEYLSGRIKSPTARVDVWQNVCSFDSYVPSITENHALGLSTVIGLALRSA